VESLPFAQLATADLVVDRNYCGGSAGNRGDDPIAKLLPVGNAGGFRFLGSPTANTFRCLVLYTSSADPDWPDRLDLGTGTFTYYGDNKRPGRQLHDTPRKGNLALQRLFADTLTAGGRQNVPPILLFSKTGTGADATFRGLLVPGSPAVPVDEQLVAIWRSVGDERFQNYRATFSVLDVRSVTRDWLARIVAGDPNSGAPAPWSKWRQTGIPERLMAPRSVDVRSREQQLPTSAADAAILAAIHTHFADRPHDFEQCAAQLWMMLAPATDELVMTKPSRDGGRDAIGTYRIGPPDDLIRIDFALEAKCYAAHSSVGVREVSRLISRLRHRNFGVLVTTSWLNSQAYKEIREDQHPVVIVCGADIVALLRRRGWGTKRDVQDWLNSEFPAVRRAGQRVDIHNEGEVELQPTLVMAPIADVQ
jgi:hypothetical protein